jgi:hypothetical protein
LLLFVASSFADAETTVAALSDSHVKALVRVLDVLPSQLDKDHISFLIEERDNLLLVSISSPPPTKGLRGGGAKVYAYSVDKKDYSVSGPRITFAR